MLNSLFYHCMPIAFPILFESWKRIVFLCSDLNGMERFSSDSNGSEKGFVNSRSASHEYLDNAEVSHDESPLGQFSNYTLLISRDPPF